MKFRSKVIALTATLVLSTMAIGGAAMATPAGPGNPGDPNVPTPTPNSAVTGTYNGKALTAQDGIALYAPSGSIVKTFELNYPTGTFSGWHKHPGIVIAVVKSGTVHRMAAAGCKDETFTVNQAFTEVGAHFVWNQDAAPAVLEITQVIPKGTDLAKLRIDVPVNPCGKPYGS